MEDEHVHKVYEEIASHFSSTRYKPWPRVDQFLKAQIPGSIGADIGGGNGKYLGYPHVYMVGYDRSEELTRIANAKISDNKSKDDVFRCDGLVVPVRPLDFAICIAVIHHFSTRERRIEAVRTILNVINENGTALVYVWALEQGSSRRGWTVGMDQDVMVPWVDNKDPSRKFERFYHLYKDGELEEDVETAGGCVLERGYEKDNWWAVIDIGLVGDAFPQVSMELKHPLADLNLYPLLLAALDTLLVSPRAVSAVVVEPPLFPLACKQKLADVLLGHFRISSLGFLQRSVCSIAGASKIHGLVIDEEEELAVPVYDYREMTPYVITTAEFSRGMTIKKVVSSLPIDTRKAVAGEIVSTSSPNYMKQVWLGASALLSHRNVWPLLSRENYLKGVRVWDSLYDMR